MNAARAGNGSDLRRTLPFAILCLSLVLCVGPGVQPPSIQAQSAAAGPALSFPLKYVETGAITTRIDLGRQEVKFRKEPDFGSNDKIVRRALKVGPGENDFMGYAINLSRHTLYLDLNQNLDLTDDPRGVYTSENIRASNLFAFFRGVRIHLTRGGVDRTYLLEPFYYLSENTSYVGIRSLYTGQIDLHGQRWLFQVQDNLDGQFDAADKLLLYRIAPPGSKIEPKAVALRPLPIPRSLFLDGRQYRLGFSFGTSPEGVPLTVTFTETATPLVELTLEGQAIRHLALRSDERLAYLYSPGPTVSLPADKYRIQGAYLQTAPGKPSLVCTTETGRLELTPGAPHLLRIGAPFVSSVVPERSGNNVLRLRYVLKGASGEEYLIENPDRGNPPKFVIYRGDQAVASGSFTFG
ncbi:MAG: hypothetical protein LAP85_25630 [Acidobacteriia bacterium]|nr:hypothetical protein [Terriglobia bacterium]